MHTFDSKRCVVWGRNLSHLFNIRVCLELLALSHTLSLDQTLFGCGVLSAIEQTHGILYFTAIRQEVPASSISLNFKLIFQWNVVFIRNPSKSCWNGEIRCTGAIAFTHDYLLKLISTETSAIHLLKLGKTRSDYKPSKLVQCFHCKMLATFVIGIKCFIHFNSEMRKGERCCAMENEAQHSVTIQMLRPNGRASKGYKSTQTI